MKIMTNVFNTIVLILLQKETLRYGQFKGQISFKGSIYIQMKMYSLLFLLFDILILNTII